MAPLFPPQEARWRDRPGLRSDFSGRKGGGRGELDKSAAVALFHPLSDAALCYEHTHTHTTKPGLIMLLFCSATILGSLYWSTFQIRLEQELHSCHFRLV